MTTQFPAGPYAPYPSHGWQGPAPVPVCQVCGAAPAALVSVRGHQGMIVMMRFLRRQGVFCKTCGTAVFREMQTDTLTQGWWGPLSAFITPVTLLVNLLSARSVLNSLPAPTTWGWRPPLDPGRPVMKRPAGLIALVPLTVFGLVIGAITAVLAIGLVQVAFGDDGPKPLSAGSCVRNDGSWSDQDLKTVSCGSSDARYRVADPGAEGCPRGDLLADQKYSEDGATNLCLHSLDR